MRGLVLGALVCAGLVAGAGVASAELIEADLVSTGDGLLTRDDDTGLEWLDLSETTNFTFTQVENDAGGWYGRGFTHATSDQISTLFSNAAPGALFNEWNTASRGGVDELIDLVGFTIDNSNSTFGRGFAADGTGIGTHNMPGYFRKPDQSGFYADKGYLEMPGFLQGSNSAAVSWGHYLVRSYGSPVPEPTTLALFGLGAGALALRRRKRRLA